MTETAVQVVVLLGPPGSGKSTVGAALVGHGMRWRDWESAIVERWGSRETFVAHKDEAMTLLHAEILDWVRAGGSPAVIETTGLSDAPLLDELERVDHCLVVRLDVSEATALARVRDRPSGRHLSDELEHNRVVWRAFTDVVAPHRRVDLAIDTEAATPTDVVDRIRSAVG